MDNQNIPADSSSAKSKEDTCNGYNHDIVIKEEPPDVFKYSSSSDNLSEITDTKDGQTDNRDEVGPEQIGFSGIDLQNIFSWAPGDANSQKKSVTTPWRSSEDLPWQTSITKSAIKPFEHECGPCLPFQHADEHTALDYFHMLVPKGIFQVAQKETNSYAEFYQDQKRDSGRECWDWIDDRWYPVDDKDEMQTLLGICLVMSVKALPNPYDYWSNNENVRERLVAEAMSPERFSKLMQYFYLSNPWRDPERIGNLERRTEYCLREPLYKLSDSLWPSIQHGCSTMYEPNRDLVLRQKSIAVKNRVTARDESSEGGWKALTIEDATNGYIYNAEFYMVDNQNDSSFVFPSEEQVNRLLADSVGKDHCIYSDTVFISPETACKLVDIGFQISANYSSWPAELSDDSMMASGEEHKSFQFKEVVASAWISGSQVYRQLRTFDDQTEETLPDNRIIPDQDSNVFPTAIAQHDSVVKSKEDRYLLSNSPLLSKLSMSDWKTMFWVMIDIALNNACVLWNESGREIVTLTEFTMEIAGGLLLAGKGSNRRGPPIVNIGNNQELKLQQTSTSFPQILHRSLLMQVSPTLCPSSSSDTTNQSPALQAGGMEIPQSDPPVRSQFLTALDEFEHSLVRFPGRGRNCKQCTAEKLRTRSGRRRDTQFGCNVCGINLCRATCFIKFHNQHKLKVNRLSITRIATLDFQPPAKRIKTHIAAGGDTGPSLSLISVAVDQGTTR